MRWQDYIDGAFNEHIDVMRRIKLSDSKCIEDIADVILESYIREGKLMVFGNGGSAADAQHFVAELVGWYEIKGREPLRALDLTDNASVLSAIANDSSYEDIFARQVVAHGNRGDVAFGITTSGNSPNVVKGLEAAKVLGLETVALTGEKDGAVAQFADYQIKVPSGNTARVQEAHITIIHTLCGLIEGKLYGK